MKEYICYHFSKNDDCLGYGDGRKIVLGETLSVNLEPVLCQQGLHGSMSIIDALGYASGSHLWITKIWGDVKIDETKNCGENRKAIREYGDLLLLIVEFAKWCSGRAADYAAESAKYAAESAAESTDYADYAADYADYAADYAAESAKYAKYAADYAAESAKYAAESAKYAADYAAKSADYADYAADSAESAKKEKSAQENWWSNKLSQL